MALTSQSHCPSPVRRNGRPSGCRACLWWSRHNDAAGWISPRLGREIVHWRHPFHSQCGLQIVLAAELLRYWSPTPPTRTRRMQSSFSEPFSCRVDDALYSLWFWFICTLFVLDFDFNLLFFANFWFYFYSPLNFLYIFFLHLFLYFYLKSF